MNKLRYLLIALLTLLIPLIGMVSPKQVHAQDEVRNCTTYELEVELSEDDPTLYTLVGDLCNQGNIENAPLMILVHGATYNSYYWDFPYEPELYSFALMANNQGYATFNIDRLGAGRSDTPPGLENDVDSNAYVLHQVVQAARNGELDTAFETIILVGHSFGSLISMAEASIYQDVDGVVLTGFTHDVPPAVGEIAVASLYPANQDARFEGTEDNYLTTVPDARQVMFYNTDLLNPEVLALDEELKDRVSVGLINAIPERYLSTESQAINVPVYILVGEYDLLFCDGAVDCSDPESLNTYESNFFSEEACLETDIVLNTGHNLSLHETAPLSFIKILTWSNETMLQNGCD